MSDKREPTAENRIRDWEVAPPVLIYRAPPEDIVQAISKQLGVPEAAPPPPPGSLTKLAALIRAADALKDR